VFNFKVVHKAENQTSFNRLKILLRLKEKITENSEPIIKEQNPLFYCSLCSKQMNYNDLIDGCQCYICNNDLFIILWAEYQKEMMRNISKKTKVCRGYLI